MKTEFLHTGNNNTLLLFFGGWTAVPEQFRYLQPEKNQDVLIIYDYTSTECKLPLDDYQEIRLVAWSLGVWAAAVTLCQVPHLKEKITQAIAVNGTTLPVHTTYGIPETIFRGTFEQLTEENLQRFIRRMCGNRDALAHFNATPASRQVSGLKTELEAIYNQQHLPVAENLFTKAIVSSGDRIFPAGNLLNFWQNHLPVIQLESPHYPFYLWNTWNDLFYL